MAKIFQLDLFINKIKVWNQSEGSEEGDQTCVEVTVFDHKEVPISGYDFGKNSKSNRGQNFLFTLDAISLKNQDVSFKILKKSYNERNKILGCGRIPIQNIFEDLFRKTFTDTNDGSVDMESQKQTDLSSTERPISKMTKDIYPIIGDDSKQCGTVCILMRLTCFGNFTTNPVNIQRSHHKLISRNYADHAMHNCNAIDHLKSTNAGKMRLSNDLAKSTINTRPCHKPMNYVTGLDSKNDNNIISDLGMCPCPPGSEVSNVSYEEFKAEIDDNLLCVRMPKNAGTVRRVDNETSKRSQYCCNRGNARNDHIHSIPIIRGNNKYPAYYGVSEFPEHKQKSFSTEKPVLENNITNCPSDVQIIRKFDDPKRDVFLLKINKDTGGGKKNEIQLEIKTPRKDYALPEQKHTQWVQTCDDSNNGGKNSKKAKKGKNVVNAKKTKN